MSSAHQFGRPIGRRPIHLSYYLSLGVIAGGSVLASATVPLRMAGLVSLITVVAAVSIERAARRRFDTRPRGRGAVAYAALGSVFFVCALALAVASAHVWGAPWVAWILAVVVFAVFAAAAWVSTDS